MMRRRNITTIPSTSSPSSDGDTQAEPQQVLSSNTGSKRTASDSPSEAPPAKRSGPVITVDVARLHHKGRILGCVVEMWQRYDYLLEKGLELSNDPRRQRTEKEENILDIYTEIISLAPCVLDEMEKAGATGVVQVSTVLRGARNKAKTDDVNSIKKIIVLWRDFPGLTVHSFVRQRHTLGFNNETTGYLLCPFSLDYLDPKVSQGIRDGTLIVLSKALPRFLWKDEMIPDPDRIHDGWLRNELLVKAYLHIFKSPSSAISDGASDRCAQRGNAAIHDICTVSLASIAYVATILHFVLSSEPTFTVKGRLHSENFYNLILDLGYGVLLEDELRALLSWWTDRIFKYADELNADEEEDEEDSTMVMMKVQVAARRAQAAMA